MKKHVGLIVGALILMALAVIAPAQAQDETVADPSAQAAAAPADAAAPPQPDAPANTVPEAPVAETFEGGINPNEIGPVIFSYWERAAINDARSSRGLVRPPTEDELMRGLKNADKPKPPPEEREIKLGGIVYVSGMDWTIWLNGKRVTPTAIPKEVIDLKVYKEYVEMKWFDDYTNQIFPLRLRAHERFNIDTRIFLPG